MLSCLETLAILDGYSMRALRNNSVIPYSGFILRRMIIPKELWAYVERGKSAWPW